MADDYLNKVLETQKLPDDSEEMKELRQHRDDVEALLKDKFKDASPTIRYGGSKAKGTLIAESYDLDLVCYFPNGENGAGSSLKEIFDNVSKALAEKYFVTPKTSAVRLKSADASKIDFHIDVVPGRFTDDSKTDCYLHQNGADKERLKTNLQVHIDHIRDAGVTPALRLLKLWRVRRGLTLKNFVWELLCIELLASVKSKSLEAQLKHVFTEIADAKDAISVEDPANPKGNDVMPFLKQQWPPLRLAAGDTLKTVENSGWEAIFGAVESVEKHDRSDRLRAMASATAAPTKPWSE